jgi:hypothetical protein
MERKLITYQYICQPTERHLKNKTRKETQISFIKH